MEVWKIDNSSSWEKSPLVDNVFSSNSKHPPSLLHLLIREAEISQAEQSARWVVLSNEETEELSQISQTLLGASPDILLEVVREHAERRMGDKTYFQVIFVRGDFPRRVDSSSSADLLRQSIRIDPKLSGETTSPR